MSLHIGQYEIKEVLGGGGMATVYRGVHRAGIGMEAAIKLLHPHYATQEKIRHRLKIEARALARLEHPNVVRLLDFVEDGDRCALITELVRGRTFRQIIIDYGETPIPTDEAVALFLQVLDGVEHAHKQQCLHRDLKPGNIMVTDDGRVRILDFGIASLLDEQSLTQTGVSIGTPVYMPPEQHEGMDRVDARSDLYSLGVTFWEVLAGLGSRPVGLTGWRLQDSHLQTLTQKGRPKDLVDVLVQCTAHWPQDRFWSCSEAREAIAQAMGISEGPSRLAQLDPTLEGPTPAFDDEKTAPASSPRVAAVRTSSLIPRSAGQSAPVSNVPTREDTFFGRVEERRRAKVLLTSSNAALVTLCGGPGTGKTRLAQQIAQDLEAAFPGGTWFCDLSEAESSSTAASLVATAVGDPAESGSGGAPVIPSLRSLGRALLILDSFERLTTSCHETLVRWRAEAPELTILATSQVALGLPGETVLQVEPLPLPASKRSHSEEPAQSPAVALFIDRARSTRPGFQPGPGEMDEIVAIVQELDGLPLAIELAAARVRLLSPAQIRERLSHQLDLLSRNTGGSSTRHSTLRGAIGWSWKLLEPWEQGALAQCSVFCGNFTLEAAEEILDLSPWPDAPWTLDVLQALIEHGLLRTQEPWGGHGEPRLRFLRPVAAFAAEQLESIGSEESDGKANRGPCSEVRAAAERRHGDYFARLGEAQHLHMMSTQGGGMLHLSLAADLPNLLGAAERARQRGDRRVAIGAATAASEALWLQGPLAAGLELLESIVRMPGMTETQDLALRPRLGLFARFMGRLDAAEEHFQRALMTAQRGNETPFETRSLWELAIIAKRKGRREEARRSYDRALERCRALGDRRLEGEILGDLAALLFARGELAEAQAHFEQAVHIHRSVGNRRIEGIHLANLGAVRASMGASEEARQLLIGALGIHREVANRRSEAMVLSQLALLHQEEGLLEEAVPLYLEALEMHRAVGGLKGECSTGGNLGGLYLQLDQLQNAESQLEAACALAKRITYRTGAGSFGGALAELRLRQGRTDEAWAQIQDAETTLRELRDPVELALVLARKAAIQLGQGDTDEAEQSLREAEGLVANRGLAKDGPVLRALGQIRHHLHDSTQSNNDGS